MKLLLVTAYVPTAGNYRGISALEYHLLKHRPKNIEVSIVCYNENQCSRDLIKKTEKELDVAIFILNESKMEKIINRYHKIGRVLSYILPRNTKVYSYNKHELVQVINKENPNWVWLYPFFYTDVAKCCPNIPFILTGCDCNSLFYHRWIKLVSARVSQFKLAKLKYIFNQLKRTERSYTATNIRVHFVGKEDVNFYKSHTGSTNAFFVPHPHYELKNKTIGLAEGKLNVLWAGSNDFYMKDDAAKVISALLDNNVNQKIKLTFLGNGWSNTVTKLQTAGYECNAVIWVDDYISEIIKYDIQITPISLGTGTKGKVLDAIANGLLCVGSCYAFENIAVEHMDSCVMYNSPAEVPCILTDIYSNRSKYETMASKGRERIRNFHNPKYCAELFFKLFEI